MEVRFPEESLRNEGKNATRNFQKTDKGKKMLHLIKGKPNPEIRKKELASMRNKT